MSDLNAKYYEQNSSSQARLGEEILDYHSFREDEIILDIGCGDGRITAQMADLAFKGKVTGIDPSQDMIDHALAHHVPKRSHLSFQIGSAEDEHIIEAYTLITSLSSLHWVWNHKLAFQHIFKSLKN